MILVVTKDQAIKEYLRLCDFRISYHEEKKEFDDAYFLAQTRCQDLLTNFDISRKDINDLKKQGVQKFNSFESARPALNKLIGK